ncbi:MAG: hypothetical protein AAF543_21835 [Pseudomonadota bacterium]
MADFIELRYLNQDVIFEKSGKLIALRARAGMAVAMQADVDTIIAPGRSLGDQVIGAFEVIELRPSSAGLEQDLDWLRGRPSVAAASHVFTIRGETALLVPDGHVCLHLSKAVSVQEQQALLTRYRLQVIEQRGAGEFLVRITSGSKNPLATAADLQAEPGVALAEPEFVDPD